LNDPQESCMSLRFSWIRRTAIAAAVVALGASANADVVGVTVTVQNLAPVDSIAFAPLHLGFHGGSFDAFDLGAVATAPIISVAEGGVGAAWQAAFAAADPGATRGTIGGPLLPGASNSLSFMVDTALNPFFTFASMVVPSNDFFISNDSPTQYRLFDAAGDLLIGSIVQTARQIWDAGSEVFDPAAAAFVGDNDLRTPQGSVAALNFAELAAFDGLVTAAGYTFESALAANTEVYRISFAVAPIPEPQTYALLGAGFAAMGAIARRRRAGRPIAGCASA
jgi:hypothetical protein